MSKLSSEQFGEFFCALHDRDPFPWQQMLAEQVCEGPWPSAIQLPTAAGKTACIDIALFSLAVQAASGRTPRTAPRRVFFVVDRRVIVDEAYLRSKKIACKLSGAVNDKKSHPVLRSVAKALQDLGGGDETPLLAQLLRGGVYRDDAWARTPAQPTIVCSTVLQYGSRLLFRGYGRSSRAWSLLAGLAGNDCLVLVDEAHCSVPFSETLAAVARYREHRTGVMPVHLPMQHVIFSATLPPEVTDVFPSPKQERAALNSPILQKRLEATKPTDLSLAARPGRAKKNEPALVDPTSKDELVLDAATRALRFATAGRQRIAVMVNRIATARAIAAELERTRAAAGEAAPFDVRLLVGRMRSWDRDIAGKDVADYVQAAEKPSDLDRPCIVVSTQCLEVGADYSFDTLITECASLDALRQRFGRLNRLGLKDGVWKDSSGVVLVRQKQLKASEDDPVYGQSLSATWNWLTADDRMQIDFGVSALQPMLDELSDEEMKELVLRTTHAPVLLPSHLDALVQTSPPPYPDPDVSLFLHGADKQSSEVQICWRGDLNQGVLGAASPEALNKRKIDAVASCPPTAAECLAVPMSAFLRWWTADGKVDLADQADVEETKSEDEESRSAGSGRCPVVRWLGPDESAVVTGSREIRTGDTLVLDANAGGWDELGYVLRQYASPQTIDIGDFANLKARGRAVLRLWPDRIASWFIEPLQLMLDVVSDSEQTESIQNGIQQAVRLRDRLKQNADGETAEPFGDVDEILSLLRDSTLSEFDIPEALRSRFASDVQTVVLELLSDSRVSLDQMGSRVVLRGSRRRKPREGHETQSHEDDSASATSPVELGDHSSHVLQKAVVYATACGLPREWLRVYETVGQWHDVGKVDLRFQAWLRDGNVLAAEMDTVILAKSGSLPRERRRRSLALARSGYPRRCRHEFLSARLLNSARNGEDMSPLESTIDADLALHLIESHHGHARPLPPPWHDDEPRPVSLDWGGFSSSVDNTALTPTYAIDTAERFWRLVRRYGPWGLAWLEAVFILADHRASEHEASVQAAAESPAQNEVLV